MIVSGYEYFEEILNCHNSPLNQKDKYPKLRNILERSCKQLTNNAGVQFSNLFARLNYLCDKTQYDKRKTYQINTFRVHANKVLHENFSPTDEEYFNDLKAVSNIISHFFKTPIPSDLLVLLPQKESYKPFDNLINTTKEAIRAEVISVDDNYIYGIDESIPNEGSVKIKHNVAGINDEFNPIIKHLKLGSQLYLLDVKIDSQNIYIPEFIVYEPDYLVDISSIAECFKEEGTTYLNYTRSKLETIPNKHYLLLGNIANMFLDELVNEESHNPVSFNEILKKSFKQMPFEFATCQDIPTDFRQTCQFHFDSIKEIVNQVFVNEGIDRDNATLEPSFVCSKLGLQGRLDFMLEDFSRIIELKSGSAQTYPNIGIKTNNYVQTLLYYAVLRYNIGKNENRKIYILYSKHKELMWAQTYQSLTKKAINLRNQIVLNENKLAFSKADDYAKKLIEVITPERLITNSIAPNFRDRFILPQIQEFRTAFDNATDKELTYFYNLLSFLAKEHYLLKAGGIDPDSRSGGISTLWLTDLKEKTESGDIFVDLAIIENHAHEEPSTLTLSIPEYKDDFLPNFRPGDIINLYQRNNLNDNVTNKQVYKGVIEELDSTKIKIRFRYKQRNKSVLPKESKYAVEHDYMDASFTSMYRGIYNFLKANTDRRELLLNTKNPTTTENQSLIGNYDNEQIKNIVLKAKQANDYFLLVGPPGTGKTSVALKALVEEFSLSTQDNILILAYTNRAVDEICDTLNKTTNSVSYIRVGSELSCEPRHRERLLENIIRGCQKGEEVKAKILEHKVIVGTIASISGKMELFRLMKFELAIVDEASQILEPHLLGILSAKNSTNNNAVKKFILIGDQKQLPAIVVQSEKDSIVNNEFLNSIGITDNRNSFFERLFNLHKTNSKSPFWSMLNKQGRMHPEIALFPNNAFYNGKLEIVPTKHQLQDLKFTNYDVNSPIEKLIAKHRISFIPSEIHEDDVSTKTNSHEAKNIAYLVQNLKALSDKNKLNIVPFETKNDNELSLGIITPYRSQIASIRREVNKLNIPEFKNITIDTVERYQGSQRDIIIYSFSVNQYYQLDFLPNNMVEDGKVIDRKLNVALTRAKQQLFLTGNPAILSNNLNYFRLIEFIKSKGSYINALPNNFIQNQFILDDSEEELTGLNEVIYEPDSSFKKVFDNIVIEPIKAKSPNYPQEIYGNSNDYNRLNLIEFGRANFDQSSLEFNSNDKVNLYCYYNMRKHYFSSISIYTSFTDYLRNLFNNSNNRICFIDFGCGPLTSGMAFNQSFISDNTFSFSYIGIDISNAMLLKAKEFSHSELFNRNTTFQFVRSINDIKEEYLESEFSLSNTVILNFSYLFGNLNNSDIELLATRINTMLDKFPLNKYVLVYQNSAMEKRNRTYNLFKKLVPRLQSITDPKTQTIRYRNSNLKNYDKKEEVYYELLSN